MLMHSSETGHQQIRISPPDSPGCGNTRIHSLGSKRGDQQCCNPWSLPSLAGDAPKYREAETHRSDCPGDTDRLRRPWHQAYLMTRRNLQALQITLVSNPNGTLKV